VHAPPAAPHAPFVGGEMHVVPAQQPLAQSAALQYAWHCPASHSVPAAQAAQAAPSVPQCALLEVWQFPLPSQQPAGQLAASQTHAPFLHSCPAAHAAQAAPSAPQALSVGGFTQVVPLQQPTVQ
jgi:hypothetical protein